MCARETPCFSTSPHSIDFRAVTSLAPCIMAHSIRPIKSAFSTLIPNGAPGAIGGD